MPHRDIVIGVTPDLPGGAKYSGKDWKKWLTQRFGRVPECREMSIQELEECLQQCGDDEVVGMRAMTEALYEGTVGRLMVDFDSMEAYTAFLDSPVFPQQVFVHKVHLAKNF